mgnify:FL=1
MLVVLLDIFTCFRMLHHPGFKILTSVVFETLTSKEEMSCALSTYMMFFAQRRLPNSGVDLRFFYEI